MKKRMELEVCAFNIQSCIIAEQAGAVRVELCDNPIEGGTTPSYGTVAQVKKRVGIEVYPIVRPRSGNYYYDADELEIIKKDIIAFKALGCEGVSVGVQLQSGELDRKTMQLLVELAYPMHVTCNRAFDGAPDPYFALEELIACGCVRVLTSGQASNVTEGAEVLERLVSQAAGRIVVMPGAGVRSENLAGLIGKTKATAYHSSARRVAPNLLSYINSKVTDYGNMFVADGDELKRMTDLLNRQG